MNLFERVVTLLLEGIGHSWKPKHQLLQFNLIFV